MKKALIKIFVGVVLATAGYFVGNKGVAEYGRR